MKEFIIVSLIGIVITAIISTFNLFNQKQNPAETMAPTPFEALHKITTNPGTIGCLSQESFQEIAQYSANKNSAAMQKMIDQGLCIYFAKGTELLLQKDACGSGNKDSEIFSSLPRGMSSPFFMTCSVIR